MSGHAALLVLLPLATLLGIALSSGPAVLIRLAGTILPAALLETILLLAGIAGVAGALGAGTAWLVTAYRFPGSRALAWLLPLPLAVPTYVAAFVAVELLDAAGPVQGALKAVAGWHLRSEYSFPEIRSLPGCILVMSLVLYPYVFVPARAAFLARGHAAGDAARTLGAGGWQVFWRVALPRARPAIAVGIALTLLEALNDIGATEYLGVRTLTLAAYTAWLNRGDLPAAAQIACLLIACVVLILALEWRWRGRQRRSTMNLDARAGEPIALTGRRAWLACVACAVPVGLGLVAPTLFLLVELVRRDLLAGLDPDFWRHAATTIGLAAGATTVILAVAVPMALATRATRRGEGAVLAWVAGLGYAVPGTILVLGLLPPLTGFGRAIDGAARALGAGAPALVLTGSMAGLVIAYLIRFLRVASAPMAAQLESAGRQPEQAARLLGAGPLAIARWVQLPLMRPALGAAALLVFVDCVKELPATLLLRPLNVDTMATLVYGAAARGSFEDGAPAALVIVLACLGPVAWLTRVSRPALAARAIAPRPAYAAARTSEPSPSA